MSVFEFVCGTVGRSEYLRECLCLGDRDRVTSR